MPLPLLNRVLFVTFGIKIPNRTPNSRIFLLWKLFVYFNIIFFKIWFYLQTRGMRNYKFLIFVDKKFISQFRKVKFSKVNFVSHISSCSVVRVAYPKFRGHMWHNFALIPQSTQEKFTISICCLFEVTYVILKITLKCLRQ